MSVREESGLSRWSRRKREAGAGGESPALEAEATREGTVAEGGVAEPVPPAPSEVRVEDLPDIETLSYGSDFTVFLQQGVPELLRRQALRKLWRSDPVLANLDGLNDYEPGNLPFLTVAEQAVQALGEAAGGKRSRGGASHRGRKRAPEAGADAQAPERALPESAPQAVPDEGDEGDERPQDEAPSAQVPPGGHDA